MNPGMSGQFSLFSCRSDCWPPSYISGPQTHTLLGLQGAIHQRKYVRLFAWQEESNITITQLIQTSSSNYRSRDNFEGSNWQGQSHPPGQEYHWVCWCPRTDRPTLEADHAKLSASKFGLFRNGHISGHCKHTPEAYHARLYVSKFVILRISGQG